MTSWHSTHPDNPFYSHVLKSRWYKFTTGFIIPSQRWYKCMTGLITASHRWYNLWLALSHQATDGTSLQLAWSQQATDGTSLWLVWSHQATDNISLWLVWSHQATVWHHCYIAIHFSVIKLFPSTHMLHFVTTDKMSIHHVCFNIMQNLTWSVNSIFYIHQKRYSLLFIIENIWYIYICGFRVVKLPKVMVLKRFNYQRRGDRLGEVQLPEVIGLEMFS